MQKATMKTLTPPSVQDIKQVEMTKFKKFVPEIDRADPIYKTPDEGVIKTIKEQKNQKVRERANRNKKTKIKATEEDSKKEDSKEGGSSKLEESKESEVLI
jgi:hypothetical protein